MILSPGLVEFVWNLVTESGHTLPDHGIVDLFLSAVALIASVSAFSDLEERRDYVSETSTPNIFSGKVSYSE